MTLLIQFKIKLLILYKQNIYMILTKCNKKNIDIEIIKNNNLQLLQEK